MFLVTKPTEAGTQTALNITDVPSLSLSLEGGTAIIYIGSQRVLDKRADDSLTPEILKTRFADLLEALLNDVKVYYLDKPVGAWKSKPTRKAAPKKEAE